MKSPPSPDGTSSSATNQASLAPEKLDSQAGENGSPRNGHVTFQTEKPFTILSALGIGYGTTNTAVGILLVLGTTIPLGGSPLVFWGFLLMAGVGLCTATTLAELCSAMPHPGGQYIWVNRLAPPRYRRFLSYATAMTSWTSSIIIGASATLSVLISISSLIVLINPDFIYQRWMGFVGFQLLNLVTVFGACFEHALPKISKTMLLLNVTMTVVIFITLFTMSKSRTSAKDFFKTTINISGWQDGVAFIIGLNGINWSFSCLDVTTHLAEEIPSPATNIPKALMWTIVVASCSGMVIILAVLINLPGIDGSADNSAIVSFYHITNSKTAAVGLWIPVLLITISAVWGVQIWQSRLAWTLSRESGFPLHRHFSKIAPAPFHTPIWSLVGSATGTAILGCLYLGSEVAFNSFVSTGILLQYISYSIPVILVLSQGRSNFQHGPFWYPRLGLIANIVMLTWSAVALLFYCFPIYLPVRAEQMNYASAIMALIPILIASLWFLYAKKNYEVKDTLAN